MTHQAKVGIFTAVTLVILVVGFYFLKGVNLFERTNSYYAVYDRVDGLYKSNIVEIDGFRVGIVGDMQRDPVSRKIVVRLDLDKNLRIPKSDSTIARLFSTDLFGTKKISLILGYSDEYYESGDTIHTSFKKDLTESVGAQIDPIITDVKNMLPTIDSTMKGINWLVDKRNPQGLHATIAALKNTVENVNTLIDANEVVLQQTVRNVQSITANIERNNAELTRIIRNFGSVSDSIQQANLKQTIENLDETIAQLNNLVAEVNRGKGTLGKIVKDEGLYTRLDSTAASLETLLRDIKARPYRYINVSVFGSKKREERIEKKYNESGK
ncbi:MAG: MlaD family protein [Chitinophagales bacterium]|nr:MlaD family protein [Chitinophagales bacterium]MDW8419257.1 MlaD family protein [Chitinophagales bacterium]